MVSMGIKETCHCFLALPTENDFSLPSLLPGVRLKEAVEMKESGLYESGGEGSSREIVCAHSVENLADFVRVMYCFFLAVDKCRG